MSRSGGIGLLCAALVVCLAEVGASEEKEARGNVSREVTAWVKGAAIPLKSTDPTSDLKDMEPLGAVVGDARIVAMGEETHGTREFFELKHRMLEYLVEEKEFTIFGIEANWPESLAVNDYVVNGTGDAQGALDGMNFLTANTEELLGLIRWMRKYNEDPTHAKKVKFYGFDMQMAHVAARNVESYLEKVDPAEVRAAAKVFEPVSDAKREKESAAKPEAFWEREEDRIVTLQREFEGRKESYVKASSKKEWELAEHNLEIVRQSAELYSIRKKGNVSPRDLAMAKNVRWILEQEGPEAKMMLWAHNGHVSTGHLGGGASMGNELRQMYGSELVVCGLSFEEGSFQAVEKGKGLKRFTVGPAPPDTVDGMLAATGIPIFAVDLRSTPANGRVREWLNAAQKMRSIGLLYSLNWPEEGFSEVIPRDFDVLFFVRQTTAAQENPNRLLKNSQNGHSEGSLRSEESLFSWVYGQERFLASLGMTDWGPFSAGC